LKNDQRPRGGEELAKAAEGEARRAGPRGAKVNRV